MKANRILLFALILTSCGIPRAQASFDGGDRSNESQPNYQQTSYLDSQESTTTALQAVKLYVFSADYCGACKESRPTIEGLIAEGYNIEIIEKFSDGQNHQAENKRHAEMSAKYGVSRVPTLIFLDKNGEVLLKNVGMLSKEKITEKLAK